jgi:hypothetical protein
MRQVRGLGAGAVLLAVGIGWLGIMGSGLAADEKEQIALTRKIAEAIQKKDTAAAKKLAEAGKNKFSDLEDVMHMLQPRTGKSGGLGVGSKPGAITPDGIEDQVEFLGKKALDQKQLDERADALAQMGYDIAAVLQIALNKKPELGGGAKTQANWNKFSEAGQKAALEFAETAKKKNPADVQKAAKMLDRSCSTCHDVFKK